LGHPPGRQPRHLTGRDLPGDAAQGWRRSFDSCRSASARRSLVASRLGWRSCPSGCSGWFAPGSLTAAAASLALSVRLPLPFAIPASSCASSFSESTPPRSSTIFLPLLNRPFRSISFLSSGAPKQVKRGCTRRATLLANDDPGRTERCALRVPRGRRRCHCWCRYRGRAQKLGRRLTPQERPPANTHERDAAEALQAVPSP